MNCAYSSQSLMLRTERKPRTEVRDERSEETREVAREAKENGKKRKENRESEHLPVIHWCARGRLVRLIDCGHVSEGIFG